MKLLKNVLFALFVVLQVYLFFVKDFEVLDYSRYVNEFPQPLLDGEKKLYKVSQTFRTPGPLARIDIMLGNYKVKPGGGMLQLGIFEGERCLFLKRYPADEVEDNQFYKFGIESGKIGAGDYTLRLRYFPGDRMDRLAVWTDHGGKYPYGDFFVDGKRGEGDMTFRVYYLSTLWRQGGRLLVGVPSVWGGRVWLVLGFVLLLLAINFLFYYLLRFFERSYRLTNREMNCIVEEKR